MNIREYALMIFTVLAQLSAGMFLVLMVVKAYAVRKIGAEKASKLMNLPVYCVFPVMALSMIASLFHLGKVLHVIGAVPNLGTSWMSREVVMAVIFIIALAVYTFMVWRKVGTEATLSVVGWVTAAIGLVLILAMSMTYMLPAQPAFNTFATPVNFFVTTFLLGALGFATVLMVSYGQYKDKDAASQQLVSKTLQGIALTAIVMLGVEFLVMPLYMGYLSTQGVAALKSLSMMVGEFGSVLALRLILAFVGAGILAVYLYHVASLASAEKMLATYVYSAFALVLVSEFLARFLFYATQFRIGV
jgi:anaerobic dimethyl sulfoxide reductase subunit C